MPSRFPTQKDSAEPTVVVAGLAVVDVGLVEAGVEVDVLGWVVVGLVAAVVLLDGLGQVVVLGVLVLFTGGCSVTRGDGKCSKLK